jgi:hypothetical protein
MEYYVLVNKCVSCTNHLDVAVTQSVWFTLFIFVVDYSFGAFDLQLKILNNIFHKL